MDFKNVDISIQVEFAQLIIQQKGINMRIADLENQIVSQARKNIDVEKNNTEVEIEKLTKKLEGESCQTSRGSKKENIKQL